jgi:mannose-6-phosphate isomerase
MDYKNSNNVIFIKPLFYERIWGGDYFSSLYNDVKLIGVGEEWLLSSIKDKETYLLDENIPLSSFVKNNSELFNNEKEIKLLFKVINAKTPLSVQVHPDDLVASKYNSLGKSEGWFIKDCKDDSFVYYGIKPNNIDDAIKLIDNKEWDKLLKPLKVNKGDFIYIPSGTVHALNESITIIEIQQSSDITYRLYDYDRVDDKGLKRDLHIKESKESIKLNKEQIIPYEDTFYKVIIDNEYFKIERLSSNGVVRYEYTKFKVVIVESGNGYVNGKEFRMYDTFILLSSEKSVIFSGTFNLLITEQK